ncbi:MAG TPA: helix-turn-helix domain-containing protein [Sulfurimonas autotrophica]|nr:helix-turn-helix domain-containing protein [Sulfurimonas autotrophica]
MSKRDLFEELKIGLEDAKLYEQEKLTLKTTTVTTKEHKLLTAEEIRAIREKYNMSRALFANFMHISPRTLEKWELGTSKPNEQASTLLALTDKYPDMLERLGTV